MLHATLSRDGLELTSSLRICQNFWERGRGLLWRPPLTAAHGDALLIPKCHSVHTFWMGYSIAVVFIGKDGTVLKICPCVPPRRVVSQKGARYTLEVASDTAWTHTLQVGQRLQWAAR